MRPLSPQLLRLSSRHQSVWRLYPCASPATLTRALLLPIHRHQAEFCVVYTHASPVLCAFTVLRHAACRALLSSMAAPPIASRVVHLVCRRTMSSRPPRTAPPCRTHTLCSTSLSSPSHLCTKLRAPMTLFATLPTSQSHRSLCCSLMCAMCSFFRSARP